jgi:predicted regulator of Ras-like GTPase activity (Roadblock/LC7/MglB family)
LIALRLSFAGAGDTRMSDTIGMVDKVLADLKNVGGVEACAVISRDGLFIHGILQKEQFVKTIAAMSATILGAAETAVRELGKGTPNRVIVESEQGRLIAVGAGTKALLVVIVNLDISLGLMLLELEKAAKKLKKLL